jgi:hypothetical protein
MDATQILNRQINKNIQTKFYTWTLTSWILLPQNLEGSSLIGRLKI